MSELAQTDPNTEAGFSAALAAAALAGGTAVNDPMLDGGSATDPTPEDGGTGTEAQPEGIDPEVQAVLDRFGGTEGLVKAFNESQQHISRQGNELGDLRQRVEAVEAQSAPAPAAPFFMSQELADQIENAVEIHGGLPVVVEAARSGNPQVYEAAIEAWGAVEPFAAARFDAQYQQQLAAIQAEQAGPAPEAQVLEELRMERSLIQAADAAESKYEDWTALGEENAQGVPFIAAAMDAVDPIIQQLVLDASDPVKQAAGIDVVVQYARALKYQHEQSLTPEQQAAKMAERVAAGVVTGALAPGGEGGTSPNVSGESDEIQAFKKRLLETPTTSIIDGLKVPEGRTLPWNK